ncbi:MAG: 6,7-dimethyl-8-ribityllumazine synthase [Planctomycetes bacterium]|nr:6,7-dimethyl-8-ribityllumazine synthase [Planctomycetota bacterium]
MHDQHQPETSAAGLRIAVAVSRYHARITDALCEAALDCFRSAGGDEELLVVVRAAGTFDLTALCRALADRGDLDAVVALGCIISGETPHDRYIASAVATGLTMITVRTGCPIAFGVLTCGTLEQALARAGGAHGNKGAEAMAAAIDTSQTIRTLGLARRCT